MTPFTEASTNLSPAKVIVVYEDGSRTEWVHDPEMPLTWRRTAGLLDGWRIVAERVEEFLEDRAGGPLAP